MSNRFAKVPEIVYNDKGMKRTVDYRVYCELSACIGAKLCNSMKLSTLGRKLEISERTASRAVGRLVVLGHLWREKRPNGLANKYYRTAPGVNDKSVLETIASHIAEWARHHDDTDMDCEHITRFSHHQLYPALIESIPILGRTKVEILISTACEKWKAFDFKEDRRRGNLAHYIASFLKDETAKHSKDETPSDSVEKITKRTAADSVVLADAGEDPYEKALVRWNDFASYANEHAGAHLQPLDRLNVERRKGVLEKLRLPDFDFNEICQASLKSEFLLGTSKRPSNGKYDSWKGVSFDYVYCTPDGYKKIISGAYANDKKARGATRSRKPEVAAKSIGCDFSPSGAEKVFDELAARPGAM